MRGVIPVQAETGLVGIRQRRSGAASSVTEVLVSPGQSPVRCDAKKDARFWL